MTKSLSKIPLPQKSTMLVALVLVGTLVFVSAAMGSGLTPKHITALAGALLFMGLMMLVILTKFFCVQLPPVWTFLWMMVAMALAGARVLAANALDFPQDYLSAVIWLHCGVVGIVLGMHAWSRVFMRNGGTLGDRCPPRTTMTEVQR